MCGVSWALSATASRILVVPASGPLELGERVIQLGRGGGRDTESAFPDPMRAAAGFPFAGER